MVSVKIVNSGCVFTSCAHEPLLCHTMSALLPSWNMFLYRNVEYPYCSPRDHGCLLFLHLERGCVNRSHDHVQLYSHIRKSYVRKASLESKLLFSAVTKTTD